MPNTNHCGLIICDFDHTLFDTTRFVYDLENAFEKVGISKNDFRKIRSELKAKQQVFDFNEMASILNNKSSINPHEVVQNILKTKATEYIFDDVSTFIKNHKENFDFLILTQGDKNLQLQKLKYSGFKNFKTIITKYSKITPLAKLLLKYDHIYFIDDKAKHIDDIKTSFPNVITYLLKRPQDELYGKNDQLVKKADFKIQNLNFELKC